MKSQNGSRKMPREMKTIHTHTLLVERAHIHTHTPPNWPPLSETLNLAPKRFTFTKWATWKRDRQRIHQQYEKCSQRSGGANYGAGKLTSSLTNKGVSEWVREGSKERIGRKSERSISKSYSPTIDLGLRAERNRAEQRWTECEKYFFTVQSRNRHSVLKWRDH